MDTTSADQYTKAKGYALRLFKFRPRSRLEIVEKLRSKGCGAEVIERVVADLQAWGYIDDEAFAKAWLQGRCKKYGYRRITRELMQKGIDPVVVRGLWEASGNEEDVEATVRAIARKRWQLAVGVEPLKRRRRVMDFLLRRGFNPSLISKVVREL